MRKRKEKLEAIKTPYHLAEQYLKGELDLSVFEYNKICQTYKKLKGELKEKETKRLKDKTKKRQSFLEVYMQCSKIAYEQKRYFKKANKHQTEKKSFLDAVKEAAKWAAHYEIQRKKQTPEWKMEKQKDYVANQIKRVQKLLPKDKVVLINKCSEKSSICMALQDFAMAIYTYKLFTPQIKRISNEAEKNRKKALIAIKKLLKTNYVLCCAEKKMLTDIQIKIKDRLSSKVAFSPVISLSFGEGSTETLGLVTHHIRFPSNRPPDLFLLHSLELIIYKSIAKNIAIDRLKRYQWENTKRNRDAENHTANIINAYFKKFGKGELKKLAKLKGKHIYTTIKPFRNLLN